MTDVTGEAEKDPNEDEAGCIVTMHPFGCILYPALLALIGYGLYRLVSWAASV